jgi:long-subunit fatty acid transport protein
MSRKRLTCIPVLAGTLVLLAWPMVALADSGFVAPLNEIPLTNPLVTGARAAGMGFVSMAVADDATAITSNPAALTRLQRVELSAGFRRSTLALVGAMADSAFSTDLTGTDFASARFAYPFPTFRGSLVLGLSFEQIYNFRDDRLAAYSDTIQWTENPDADPPESDLRDLWYSEEDYIADGGMNALSFACAFDASPTISLGATVSFMSGDYSKDWFWDLYDDYDASVRYAEVHIMDRYKADITGWRVTLGSLFYVAEGLSVGVAVDTPTWLTFEGTARSYTELVESDSTTVYDSSVLFRDKVTLPFAFRGGVAYAPLDFIVVGVDLSYSDWSQMDYEGRITDIEQGADGLTRRDLYKETLGYGIGAELTVPSWPLRLRGGYVHRPVAYNGLEVTSDRSYYTVGAGILIDTVLAVDVAWMKGSYERADSDFAFSESIDESALIVEAAYRF